MTDSQIKNRSGIARKQRKRGGTVCGIDFGNWNYTPRYITLVAYTLLTRSSRASGYIKLCGMRSLQAFRSKWAYFFNSFFLVIVLYLIYGYNVKKCEFFLDLGLFLGYICQKIQHLHCANKLYYKKWTKLG